LTTDFEDLKIESVRTRDLYTDGNTLYAPEGITYGLSLAGVSTNLPLNTDTEYSIEFYMKEYGNELVSPGLAWSGTGSNNAHAFSINRNGEELATSRYGGQSKQYAYGNFGEVADRADRYGDADGYIRYTVIIDGYNITLYMGGEQIGETLLVDKRNNRANDTPYVSQTLQLMIGAYNNSNVAAGDDNPWVSVKDITVWSGIQPIRTATFIDGENETSVEFDAISGRINAPELKYEAGERWTYKNAISENAILTENTVFTNDVKFEKHIFGDSDIEVAAA
jgi:hypothetical protein